MTKLEIVRNLMAKRSIDAYMIVSDDYHNSEYVGDYFKVREYVSGFTGSAGTVVITMDKAGLWTDGRYFVQAEKQLEGTGIDLYKSGMPGVPTIEEFLKANLKEKDVVCVDGKTVSYEQGKKLNDFLEENQMSMFYDVDLVSKFWEDRPEMSKEKAYSISAEYTGQTREEKLARLREKMKENNREVMVLSSLDDICWLLNIRGNDIRYNPVVLAYMIISLEKCILYVGEDVVSEELAAELKDIRIRNYMDIYEDIKKLKEFVVYDRKIMFDGKKTNYAIGKLLMGYEDTMLIENPTTMMKAVKTSVEVKNMREAHIMDGVALTKFMYHIKKQGTNVKENEYELGKLVAEYRSKNEGYMGESFEPIVAFGANAAMCHYEATEDECSAVGQDSFLLFDTGGQYLKGTTDVTRTIAIGQVSALMKKHYTAVLKGNLRLGAIRFPYGVRGINLDVLARESLWEIGLDYNHGTGHGVGYFLNVHEGPNSIRFRGNDTTPFEEGMITSNEPGYYEEGKYGIRLENLILCKELCVTEYGKFMEFETLTFVPFDKECIDISMLNEKEKTLLNNYHSEVYKKISPYLEEEEKEWLKEATEKI